MGSLVEELKRREASARGGPAAEPDRGVFADDLARPEERASRLAIAREEVTRVLEGRRYKLLFVGDRKTALRTDIRARSRRSQSA